MSMFSQLLVVTLAGQVEPVFVDLRPEIGGRWLLEAVVEEVQHDEDDEEEEPVKRRWVPPLTQSPTPTDNHSWMC